KPGRSARAVEMAARAMSHHHPDDPRTIRDLVDAQAAVRGSATYLIADESGRTIDFAALQASCRTVERLIAGYAVARGENVAVVMPNGAATVALLLGTMYAGRCVVPVNLLSQPE